MPSTWKLGVVFFPERQHETNNWIPNFQILSENSGKAFFHHVPQIICWYFTEVRFFVYSLDISDTLDIKLQKNMHLGGLPSTNHHQNCCIFEEGIPNPKPTHFAGDPSRGEVFQVVFAYGRKL